MNGEDPVVEMDIGGNDEEEIGTPTPETQDLKSTPVEFHIDAVTTLNQCQTQTANKLCIFNLDNKLENNDQYDIGGTYTDRKPDLWFYYTTSTCPDYNYLLNIFVNNRNKGTFKISISETKSLTKMNNVEPFSHYLLMPNKLTTKTFKSSQIDESHFIQSYCFTKADLASLSNKTLCIPIQIDINPKCSVDTDVLMRIKENHGLSNIFKKNENTDFILESTSGNKYNAHKIVLVTHSPVLKDIVRNSKSDSAIIDINDDEMELLLEFMYTGKIGTISDDNCYQLLDISQKFELENLLTLTKFAITQKITVKNAIDIAVLTEKYKLYSTQKEVFEFIKSNPGVLDTEGWQNLSDVALTKKLFKEVFANDTKLNN